MRAARFIFLGLGSIYLVLGFRLGLPGGGLIWLGMSLFVVGLAYARNSSWLLGKRVDGSFHPVAMAVHAPFLLAAWAAWHLRRSRAEPPWGEVAPGIFIGRMVTFGELPPDVGLVVDMTCELLVPAGVRGHAYRCLPTLDGGVPEPTVFRVAVKEAASCRAPVFIHCAAGRGRSATLAAASRRWMTPRNS